MFKVAAKFVHITNDGVRVARRALGTYTRYAYYSLTDRKGRQSGQSSKTLVPYQPQYGLEYDCAEDFVLSQVRLSMIRFIFHIWPWHRHFNNVILEVRGTYHGFIVLLKYRRELDTMEVWIFASKIWLGYSPNTHILLICEYCSSELLPLIINTLTLSNFSLLRNF